VPVRPRILGWYGSLAVDTPRSPSGPLRRWYGPTLAEPAGVIVGPPTVVMGAGPAPAEPQYLLPSSQSYAVRTPLLLPRPLPPAGAGR
jgi:hypothetical protein